MSKIINAKAAPYIRMTMLVFEKKVCDEQHCFVVQSLFLSIFRLKPQFLKPKQNIQLPKSMFLALMNSNNNDYVRMVPNAWEIGQR